MTRDFARLTTGRFDVLVIGGGIHGLFAAFEAASRGASVALVDADDYGSGLSFNHQRTVHGGLRSLQTGHMAKARAQVDERRRWAEMAPLHVRPLAFVVGTYRGGPRSRGKIRLGFALYNAVASGRNDGLPADLHLPDSRLLASDEALARFPGINTEGLTGAATWSDYQTRHPDRLNWLVARSAIAAGATLVNHAEVVEGLRHDGHIVGAIVRDRLTGHTVPVRARRTLLTAGAGLPALYERFGFDDDPPALIAAANLLIDRAPLADALAAPTASGRMLTAVPWRGRTLVGTFQSTTVGRPGDAFPIDVGSMIAEANCAFPQLGAEPREVRLVHRGWTPAEFRKGSWDLMAEPQLVRHSLRGVPGAYSLVGVKFTTARLAAVEAVRQIASDLNLPDAPADDSPPRLTFGTRVASEVEYSLHARGRAAGLDDACVEHLMAWYGDEAVDIVARIVRPELARRLDPQLPVVEVEVVHAVETAHARRLADVVQRRTALGDTGRPSTAALQRCAELMGEALGWNDARRADELARVEERYACDT